MIQPDNNTECIRGVAVFTCVVDRNHVSITSDDVRWERFINRISNYRTISRSGATFNITTTINEDILTSILTINGVRRNHVGLYRCVIPASNVMSTNASLEISRGKMCNTIQYVLSMKSKIKLMIYVILLSIRLEDWF